VLLSIFVIYPLAFWYDLYKIEKFCNALSTETKVESLLTIATKYGVETKYGAKTLTNAIKEKDGTFFSFIASMFTMGDAGCFIKHDGQKIITAKYENH